MQKLFKRNTYKPCGAPQATSSLAMSLNRPQRVSEHSLKTLNNIPNVDLPQHREGRKISVKVAFEREKPKYAKQRNKDWLIENYCNLKRLVKDIANECGVGIDTIYSNLKKFNITPNRCLQNVPSKEKLDYLYITKKYSTFDIAKIYNIGQGTVYYHLIKNKIKIRTASESSLIVMNDKGGRKRVSISQKKLWNKPDYVKMHSDIKLQAYKDNPEIGKNHSAKMQGVSIDKWEGHKESENLRIRKSNKYKIWRTAIFKKDNYTCQCCKKQGVKLRAHHIENFSTSKDLRFDISNGITLCNNCHSISIIGSFHNIYGTKNNSKEQLMEYILTRNRKQMDRNGRLSLQGHTDNGEQKINQY